MKMEGGNCVTPTAGKAHPFSFCGLDKEAAILKGGDHAVKSRSEIPLNRIPVTTLAYEKSIIDVEEERRRTLLATIDSF